MSLSENHIWKVLEAYARKNTLVQNQIDSYNDFVNFGIQEIIDQESCISIPNYILKFGQVYLSPPQVIEEDRILHSLYPNDARIRDLNYDSAILCDITEIYTDNNIQESKTHTRVLIGRMPVMLKSCICNLSKLNEDEIIKAGECSNDLGGYFIIKGNERVLVGQLRTVYNQVFVLPQKPNEKYKWIAETRSMSDETGHSVLLQAMIGNDDRTICFSLPYIKEPIPVGVVFKALGYNEEEIPKILGLDSEKANKYIRYILRDSFFCKTKEDALKYISKFSMHIITENKERDYSTQVIECETLPHIGISGSLKEKAFFLGRMIKKLINTHIGERSEDDRDNYTNKRIDIAGSLLYDIFRNLFKRYIQFIKLRLEKRKQRPDIISVLSGIKSITQGLHRCLATGNWGIQKNATYVKTGVSQILDRMTYCATLSHLRRVLIPMGKEGKNIAMRQIHSSSFGFICPCECFDPDTEILLWNGTIKTAKEIIIGDILINEKGEQTKVKSTCSGFKEMFEIQHSNKNFQNYTVTSNHILTLKSTLHKKIIQNKLFLFDKSRMRYTCKTYKNISDAISYKNTIKQDDIFDIPIDDYIKFSDQLKNTFKMFKGECVNWPKIIVKQDPFLLGCLVREQNYKNIPKEYIINDKETRSQLLAGLINDEGKIIIPNELLSNILFLIKSLGFSLNFTTQQNYTEIILNLPEYSDFQLVRKPVNCFVGWQLEGTGRFLLGDFTVTHNTPEGQKIGVVLNYALLTKITKRISKVATRNVIEKCKSITFTDKMDINLIKDWSAVYINDIIIGFSEDPELTVLEIKRKRSQGLLDSEVSVFYDIVDNDIKIFCDEGRCTRPLFTLNENKLNIQAQEEYKWDTLLKKGLIRYVDAGEIENCVIAMTPEILKIQHCDFCEIHPSTMLGIMASMIPFPDHSQSPRNCYQSSMGKQALGMPILSHNLRSDTLLHVLHYPQRPLVSTKTASIFNINEMPSGLNAIVAIACYSGFNQEDSVMLNLSSIQRGLFCLTSYHTIDCCEKKRDTYSFEEIRLPPVNTENIKEGQPGFFKRKNGNYSLLDENGIIKPREKFENGRWVGSATVVKKGDVLIGKVVVTGNKLAEESRIDASVIVQPGEEGTIDRIFTTITPSGYKLVKIIIRVTREPTLGDKLASRAAQKGTVGMVYRQEDMPFTSSGIVPDIIINPLCLSKDSVIRLSERHVKTIDKVIEEKEFTVDTVNPKTFKKDSTLTHSPFKIQSSRKIVKVETISGRSLICTDDHPFLCFDGTWKNASDLKPEDTISIVHTIKPLPEIGEIIDEKFIHKIYKINLTLDEKNLQVLARILGIIESDGHLIMRNKETQTFRTVFYINDEKDIQELSQDIISLGFPEPKCSQLRYKKNIILRLEASPSLGFVLYKLGAHVARKSNAERKFPCWLLKSSKEVKRQFLSGFQGGNGSKIFMDNGKITIKPTISTCKTFVLKNHIDYMNGIRSLFTDLDIKTTLQFRNPRDINCKEVCLYISRKSDNIEKYADYIYYAYSSKKTQESQVCIEYLKIMNNNAKCKLKYEDLSKMVKGDCIGVNINKVQEVKYDDFVYDFATVSENHSFIANSIVVHNCIPSRMTINQLIETALGKECSVFGKYEDCTPFTENSINIADKLVKRLETNLQKYGHQKHGYERMYNGMTGEMMEANIFMGPTYYQRLKHMVDDKMHARAQGHVTMLTRQPLEGRSRDGGLRFGEMERDCMIAHGNSAILKERLFLVSDPFQLCVCDKCGIVTSKINECQNCKTDSISLCNIPYASKLLYQELTAMGIKINIKSDKYD